MTFRDESLSVMDDGLSVFGETVYYQTASGAGDPFELTVIWQGQSMWLLRSSLAGARIAKNDIVRRGDYTYRVVNAPESQAPYVPDNNDESADGITVHLRLVSQTTNV